MPGAWMENLAQQQPHMQQQQLRHALEAKEGVLKKTRSRRLFALGSV
jgi:hypothetical protein